MRVGIVTSSRTFMQNLKKNLILIVVMSLLYAINSFAIGEIKLLPNAENGGGELRPFIFIPALASIIFGPIVGSFSAGIGNLLIDFVQDRLIQGDILDLGNFAGMVGNFLGAAVVGFLAWRLKFDKDDKVILSGKIWLRYLQNAVAAIVGMGLVTGETIGLLRVAFQKSTWEVGNIIATSIFFSNSLFLVITIIPLQLVIGFYEKIRAKRYDKALHNSKNVTLLEEPDKPPALIEKFIIIPGAGTDGLVKGEWSQIEMVLRNNTNVPMTFRLEINCEDRINPSVTYTKLLKSQEIDEKFFQINPFNDADRVFTVYIKSWSPTFKQLTEVSDIGLSVRYRYTYNALTPFEHQFNFFMKFLSICSFGIFVFNIIRSIYSEVGTDFIDQYFIWAMIVCGVEVLIVFGWYIYKLISVKRKIKRIKDKAEEDQAKAQKKREIEQVYYQQELMKIKEQYDLTIDETKPLPDEQIVYEEIIEEVQEEPTEITPEPEVELVKEGLPEIPAIEPREEIEPTTEELVSVEEEPPEEVLTFQDEDQPSQDEQVIDESTEQEEATEEEEETWESMYDYNQIDEEDEEE
ncbi:MAG: hypothetical protein FK730_08365 [Asgard group archaeon]|nr:hypothetical protein [Asgard group archaeon]